MTKSKGQRESRKHEDRLAKAVGGKRNAASGAFWSRKGDVRNHLYLLEHKWTGKKSFTVKSEELEKITTEAVLDGRIPVFGIHLNGHNYVLTTEDDFLELFSIIAGKPYENLHQMQTDISGDPGVLHKAEEIP